MPKISDLPAIPNYGAAFANINPMQSFTRGLAIADRTNAQIAQARAAEAQAQRQAQVQGLLQKISQGGTAEDRAQLTTLVAPEQAKILQSTFEGMDKERREASARDSMMVFAAIDQGETDIAKQLLSEQAEAARAGGNEQAAKMSELAIKMMDESPSAAMNWLGGIIPFNPEGKTAMDSYLAQRKSSIDAQNEANGGKLTSDQVMKAEADLHKQYISETADFQSIRNAYAKIINSDKTGAGDISLVYSYMKMLDPTSVVREGEFATAANAGGVPDRVVAQYNKALNGQMLPDGIRNDFKSQAERVYKAAKQKETIVRNGVTRVAKNNGLNLENVLYEDEPVMPVSETGTPAPAASGTAPSAAPLASFNSSALTITSPDGNVITYPDKKAFEADMAKLKSRGVKFK